jgi:hypothetical protein
LNKASNQTPAAEYFDGTIPLPHPLKQKIKDGIVALSLANLCFTSAWFCMLYDQDYGYFNRLPVLAPSLLALLANILGLAAVIWLGMCIRRRFPNRALRLGLDLAFLALMLIPMYFFLNQIFHIVVYQIVAFLKQPVMMVCITVFLALIVWQHNVVAKIAAVLVAVTVPLVFLTMSKIVLL